MALISEIGLVPRLPGEDFQELCHRNNLEPFQAWVVSEGEEVFVSCDQVLGTAAQGQGKYLLIFGIPHGNRRTASRFYLSSSSVNAPKKRRSLPCGYAVLLRDFRPAEDFCYLSPPFLRDNQSKSCTASSQQELVGIATPHDGATYELIGINDGS